MTQVEEYPPIVTYDKVPSKNLVRGDLGSANLYHCLTAPAETSVIRFLQRKDLKSQSEGTTHLTNIRRPRSRSARVVLACKNLAMVTSKLRRKCLFRNSAWIMIFLKWTSPKTLGKGSSRNSKEQMQTMTVKNCPYWTAWMVKTLGTIILALDFPCAKTRHYVWVLKTCSQNQKQYSSLITM